MANRFTRRNIFGRFDKLSLDELSFLPMAMQQAHEQALAGAESLRTYKNALSIDTDLRDQLQGEINTGIQDITDSLMNEGVNPQVTQNLIKLKRRRDDLVNPGGQLYDIESNYNKYLEFDKQLRETEGVGLATKNRYRSYVRSTYKGVAAGDSLAVPDIVGDADAVKIATEAVKDMPTHIKQKLLSKAGIEAIGTNANGSTIYRMGDETVEENDPVLIQELAMRALDSSPEFQSMMQRDRMFYDELGNKGFGLREGATFEDYSNSIIGSAMRAAELKAYDKDVKINVDFKFDRFNEGYYGIQLMEAALRRPTIISGDYVTNKNYSKEQLDKMFEPTKVANNKLVMENGDVITKERFMEMAAEADKNPDEGSGLFALAELAQKMFGGSTNNKAIDWSTIYNLATDGSLGDKGLEQLETLGISVKPLTSAERQQIIDAAESHLKGAFAEYSSNQNNPKLSYSAFKLKYKSELENMANVNIETQHFGKESDDPVVRDIVDNKNLAHLRNTKLVILDEDGDEVVPVGEDALEFIHDNLSPDKISSVGEEGVITNYGDYTGGRKYSVIAKDGKTYNVYAAPNTTEGADYYALNALSTAASAIDPGNPSIESNGSEIPLTANNSIKYVPYNSWENGRLVKRVKKFQILRDDQGNIVDSRDETPGGGISLEMARNEIYQKDVLPRIRYRYMSPSAKNKNTTNQ